MKSFWGASQQNESRARLLRHRLCRLPSPPVAKGSTTTAIFTRSVWITLCSPHAQDCQFRFRAGNQFIQVRDILTTANGIRDLVDIVVSELRRSGFEKLRAFDRTGPFSIEVLQRLLGQRHPKHLDQRARNPNSEARVEILVVVVQIARNVVHRVQVAVGHEGTDRAE